MGSRNGRNQRCENSSCYDNQSTVKLLAFQRGQKCKEKGKQEAEWEPLIGAGRLLVAAMRTFHGPLQETELAGDNCSWLLNKMYVLL